MFSNNISSCSGILLRILISHKSKVKDESQPKIWYYQDRYQIEAEKEVNLGMDNNVSYRKIYTTPDYSLVIKTFLTADAGIYRCHGEEGQEKEDKYNYRIERSILLYCIKNFNFCILFLLEYITLYILREFK